MKRVKGIPNAKPFWFDALTGMQYESKVNERCTYYDSTLEFKLHHKLLAFIPANQIKRQVPILYKPETKIYKSLHWKVDFSIQFSTEMIFVEAKGGWILNNNGARAEFQHKLQFLEYVDHRVWNNLYLVSDTKMRLDSFYKVLSIDEFVSILRIKMAEESVKEQTYHA